MLLMYSLSAGARLQYIVNFFSQELFDAPVRITTSIKEYMDYDGPRLNYSASELAINELWIAPAPLLFETGIRPQQITTFHINFHKAFFATEGDLHYDIFAASFYLLSRYEEYLPHEKDSFGRFPHTQSLAYREGFLNQPLINIWMQELRSALAARFPELRFKGSRFANLITYDIDIAYSYLYKGLLRNIGGTFRSIWKGQWRLVIERWKVLLGLMKDPFDCYEWLDALQLYCRLKPYYFFLVARSSSEYDKNVSTSSRRFRDLVQYYSATYNIGIHPSWQSGADSSILREEIEWLEATGGKQVKASRQHFIRFNLPDTYRQLISAGIRQDFSMGYGSINGFRASVCSQFKWYDLSREEATSLTILPFCFMDANSFYEQRHTPREAYEELMSYYNSVKKVNGMLVTVWHNHLLGQDPRTRGWSEMFELFMKETVYWDAYYDGSSQLSKDVPVPRVFS